MKNRFILFWMPIVLLCALIFYNSSNPYPESIPQLPLLDKLIHFLVYGLLGALFFRAIRDREDLHGKTRCVILSILAASLYGISDEIHQSFVPERVADIFDALADIFGSTGGVLLYQHVIHKYYESYPYHSHIDKIENII